MERQSRSIMHLFPLNFPLNCQIRKFEMEANLSIVFYAQALQGPNTDNHSVFELKKNVFLFLLNSWWLLKPSLKYSLTILYKWSHAVVVYCPCFYLFFLTCINFLWFSFSWDAPNSLPYRFLSILSPRLFVCSWVRDAMIHFSWSHQQLFVTTNHLKLEAGMINTRIISSAAVSWFSHFSPFHWEQHLWTGHTRLNMWENVGIYMKAKLLKVSSKPHAPPSTKYQHEGTKWLPAPQDSKYILLPTNRYSLLLSVGRGKIHLSPGLYLGSSEWNGIFPSRCFLFDPN